MKHMFNRNRVRLLVAAAALVCGVAACYPGGISSVGEADLVLTFFDSTANFSGIGTYVMPDTIVRFDDEGSTGEANATIDAEILDAVAAELMALGYQRLDENSATPPDVVVLLGVNRTDVAYWVPGGWWGYWGYYPGWGGWYPGWGPGYGPGYPWGPGYGGVRSTGTLLITMLDGDGTTGVEIAAIWAGAINGLIQGSDAAISARLRGLISQAFRQSPYL